MADLYQQGDICRVCRSEGSPDKPLHFPCLCTGSIKYIHQECLLQWLKYSRKEYCELCHHRFSFVPIYSPDMPRRLPIRDVFGGLLSSISKAVKYWLHYTLVAFAWLGVVPLTACRIYRCLFTGSVSSVLSLPLDIFSTENLLSDCLHGCLIVTCTLCAFISLVWLREQILHGGGPDWLEPEPAPQNEPEVVPEPPVVNEENDGNGGDIEEEGLNEQPVPDVAAVNNNNNNNNNAAPAAQGIQDDNWNPIEWDRAAEELTWERLLGLDGSLVFLEHVFWVISLNTLFILVFTFCPYHIGHFLIVGFKLNNHIVAANFDGFVTTLCGYIVIGVSLVFMHTVSSLLRFRKSTRILGLCYAVVKVTLLCIIEIGIFPLICGIWLDVCSLPLLASTLQDREVSFKSAPGTSVFIHWLIGMVYIFYFASFIFLLREVLRPGTLWFLRNLNDPEFNPVQEMIQLPLLHHFRRFLATAVIFGTTVILMLRLPVYIIDYLLPKFLPYNIILSSDTPVRELSLELLLLQVIIPALLEQGQSRVCLRTLIRWWCIAMSYLLSLRSYLLGDVPLDKEKTGGTRDDENRTDRQQEPVGVAAPAPEPANVNQNDNQAQPVNFIDRGLAAAHHALLNGPVSTESMPYNKPNFFAVRIILLVLLISLTMVVSSVILLVVPVSFGRFLLSLWAGDDDLVSIHEMYTMACGLYACWLIIRANFIIFSWILQGLNVISRKIKYWSLVVVKCAYLTMVMVGIVPLLVGLLFELVIFIPLRVPLNQSAFFFLWQDWVLGVLYVKIIGAGTMMGPRWWLKESFEQAYQNGVRNINMNNIHCNLIFPVLFVLGLMLSVPYIVANSLIPLFGVNVSLQIQISRKIYPSLLAIVIIAGVIVFQIKQFARLYEHIRNDKYLVGRRLVNYENRKKRQNTLIVS